MFKIESIRKIVALANEKEKELKNKNISEIKICISKGNKKIGKVMNVSLMPVKTCGNCKQCMLYCYDIKACLQYPNTVIDARMRNTVLLKRDRNEYFNRIENAIERRRTNKYFRWHVAGDIVDADYFDRMVTIAEKHPDFIFWTYTKMYHIVNNYLKEGKTIPGNLHIMFSEWDGMPLDNPYGMPVFTCKLKDGNKNHKPEYFDTLHRCPGNCDICKMLNRGCIKGENTYVDEH